MAQQIDVPAAAAFPVPEPDLTPQEVVARAQALRERVRAEAADAERDGGYSPQLHRAFVDAGFFRVLQPRRYGGYGFDLETFFGVTMAIAEGDLGTGWNLSLGSAHVLQVCAYFGEQAQDELFAHRDGYFSSPHRAAPEGTATKVDGGYRVSGRWAYSSGATYGSHFIATSMGPGADGRMAVLAPIIPIEQVTVLDDWGGANSIGLRASGSNTVVADDVFVADHLVVDGVWLGARHPPEGPIGFRVHEAPMYLGRTMTIYYGELAALLVGAARASVAEFERLVREKTTPLPPVIPRIESPDFLRWLGQARRRTNAAEALVRTVARRYVQLGERFISEGVPFSIADDDELRNLALQAQELATEAVELCFRRAGASATRPGSVLERAFRDVSLAATHPAANLEDAAEMSSRLQLGIPPEFIH
jgi:3-hydroxy-9,10-secoandrosta-1,3,5(10)-triene-9,17-dione monooxygenase